MHKEPDRLKEKEAEKKMFEMTDPEEFCMNCWSKITGRYRTCEFCGKIWWKREKETEEEQGGQA